MADKEQNKEIGTTLGFHNKRILFVCRETYSMPLWFLANEWREDNEVAAFFIMSSECSYNKCYYNENSYYKFKEQYLMP